MLRRILLWATASALIVPSMALAQAKGQDTFKARCAGCHGADGKGATAMGKTMGLKSLASPEVQSTSDSDLTNVIANGKGKMPAYKGKLTDAQIKDVVAYIKTLK